MTNGDVVKPNVCLLSTARFESQVRPINPVKEHTVLEGGPELVVEIRSPSSTRKEAREKRQKYFDSGTLIVWDVEPKKHKIWVWEASQPELKREYKADDLIDCPQLLPGWTRKVGDFFARSLSAEDIVGQEAQRWRSDTLRQVLLIQASRRFPPVVVADLEASLAAVSWNS